VFNSNHSCAELNRCFADALGLVLNFRSATHEVAVSNARQQAKRFAATGKQHVMHPVGLAELQTVTSYLNLAPAMEASGYGPHGLTAAITDSVLAIFQFNDSP
jgi:hypothetical protein